MNNRRFRARGEALFVIVLLGAACKKHVLHTVLHTRVKIYTQRVKLYTRMDFTHGAMVEIEYLY